MWLFLILLAGIVFFFVRSYNSLRALAEQVKGARGNIFAAVRKRVDLAKRIGDIAQSYADHEKIVQINASEMNDVSANLAADASAQSVVSRVSALAMSHPSLKANKTYEKLMDQWYVLEDDIQERRERYNDICTHYNGYRGALPQVLFAETIGFGPAPYYETDEEGADVLPEFQTGDAQHLADTFARVKGVAATQAAAALQTAHKAKITMEQTRERNRLIIEQGDAEEELDDDALDADQIENDDKKPDA